RPICIVSVCDEDIVRSSGVEGCERCSKIVRPIPMVSIGVEGVVSFSGIEVRERWTLLSCQARSCRLAPRTLRCSWYRSGCRLCQGRLTPKLSRRRGPVFGSPHLISFPLGLGGGRKQGGRDFCAAPRRAKIV